MLQYITTNRNFKKKRMNDYFIVERGAARLCLYPEQLDIMLRELKQWEFHYLPFSLEGKTVLDIGCGSGETAFFFFDHGAYKVIGVESNPKYCSMFRQNSKANSWNTELHEEPFHLEHLKKPFDLCKIDVEGAEASLLSLDELTFSLILETHSDWITKALLSRFPSLRCVFRHPIYQTSVLSNQAVRGESS